MSSQAEVHSIEALKDFRVVLALSGEETLEALAAVDLELRRTVYWLEQDRPLYWQEQIKRRREQVASAKSELFRRQLQKTPEYHPSMVEQKENLRRAEASLQDAEKRMTMVRKWQPLLRQAILEYHGSIQRIKGLAAGDVPSAVNLLNRIIDALEAYLQVAPPAMTPATAGAAAPPMTAPPEFERIAVKALDEEPTPGPAGDAAGRTGEAGVAHEPPGEPGSDV
jgi:hypothetical protein